MSFVIKKGRLYLQRDHARGTSGPAFGPAETAYTFISKRQAQGYAGVGEHVVPHPNEVAITGRPACAFAIEQRDRSHKSCTKPALPGNLHCRLHAYPGSELGTSANPSSHPVAETILAQLGGRKFIVMTGADSFTSSPTALTFKLPRPSKIRGVRITLTANDLYTMTFY